MLVINTNFSLLLCSSVIGARANKAIFKTAVVDLDSSNFDSVALDKTKDVLVEFYAPCKDCIRHFALIVFSFDNLPFKGNKCVNTITILLRSELVVGL